MHKHILFSMVKPMLQGGGGEKRQGVYFSKHKRFLVSFYLVRGRHGVVICRGPVGQHRSFFSLSMMVTGGMVIHVRSGEGK